MSISTILVPLLVIGGIFLMMRMHGGHGGRGGSSDGGHGGGSHGSSDSVSAEPVPDSVGADEAGKPKPSGGHSGH